MENGQFLDRYLPETPVNTYSLTKALQENIARYYHERKGTEVAVFRPAHICDEDTLVDKYEKKLTFANWVMIDPRDIAEAVRPGADGSQADVRDVLHPGAHGG